MKSKIFYLKSVLKNSLISIILLAVISCSFANEKKVSVPITSSPSGANVYVNGVYFGQTPTFVKLEPVGTYSANLVKNGYGSTKIDLETWYSVRGGRGADSSRCLMDALGTMLVIPAFALYSVHCRDFKEESYNVIIGNNGSNSSNFNNGAGYNFMNNTAGSREARNPVMNNRYQNNESDTGNNRYYYEPTDQNNRPY